MTVLLDTHALLWALMEPDRLSPRARAVLQEPTNTLLVSAASAWEIATKYRLGRLPDAEAVLHNLEGHLQTLGATPLSVSIGHALAAGRLRHDHRDPFDRMLVAQALVESVPLVTADAALRGFPISIVW